MGIKFPTLPAPLSENYEFALFALLFLFTLLSGDAFAAMLLAAGWICWLALSRILKSGKKTPSEREKALAALFTKYKRHAYYLLAASFALFLFLKSSALLSLLFLVLIGITMVFIVAAESFAGYLEGGVRSEMRECVLAILWALSIWFFIGFLLGTKVPFNGVVSCSMVPQLERGDLLLLRADSPASTIVLSKEEFDSLTSLAVVDYKNSSYTFNGSIFSYCVQHPAEEMCIDFAKDAISFEERHGPLTFSYGYCERVAKGSNAVLAREICVRRASYNGKPIAPAPDIAVYEPNKGDLFSYSGDIVHRIIARFSYANSTKYITKGDNNPVADMQVHANSLGNSPFPKERVKGIVALQLPYLGFFKLALSSPLNPSLALAVENCESYYK